jgi:hypothetical protein
MQMIIIVTGEREWKDRKTIYRVLDEELAKFVDLDWFPERDPSLFHFNDYDAAARAKFILRHGINEGADWIANDWARERGVTVERFRAEWNLPGGGTDYSAGPRRNREMAQKEPRANLCLAFWSGKFTKRGSLEVSGTYIMITEALAAGITVNIHPPRTP